MFEIEDLDLLRTEIDILTRDKHGFDLPKDEINKEQLIIAQQNYIQALLSLLGGEADV